MTDAAFTRIAADLGGLAAEVPIEAGRVRGRRLFRGAGGTVMGMAIDAGAEMREHVAPVPVLVVVVEGRIRCEVQGEQFELAQGGVVQVDANEPHAVFGVEPSRFLLVMLSGG